MNYGAEAGQALGRVSYDDMAKTAREVPQSAVPSALNHQDKAIAYLHERIANLHQRLQPILAPQPPEPVGNVKEGLARHSLAMQIESNASSIEGACRAIDSIIQRIEL